MAAAAAQSPASARRMRVLVADDNRDMCISLELLLQTEGYEVVCAGDGLEATMLLAEFHPDVVVADIKMPRRSGWELARLVRNVDGSTPGPLLIAMSGHYKQGADRVLSQLAGFDYFLAKPVDPSVLLALVGRHRDSKGFAPV